MCLAWSCRPPVVEWSGCHGSMRIGHIASFQHAISLTTSLLILLQDCRLSGRRLTISLIEETTSVRRCLLLISLHFVIKVNLLLEEVSLCILKVKERPLHRVLSRIGILLVQIALLLFLIVFFIPLVWSHRTFGWLSRHYLIVPAALRRTDCIVTLSIIISLIFLWASERWLLTH